MDTRKNALTGALALILGMPLAGHAQTNEEDFVSSVEVIPDFYNTPGIVDSAPGAIGSAEMDVDPHSGTLTIAHTDVSIPGNGGLDLNLTRYYHSLHPQAENFYSPAGVGWTLHFGKIMTSRPAFMCNPIYNAHIQDNPVYLAPDGSRRPLSIGVRADSGGPDGMVDQANFRYITRNFDAVFCEGYDDPDPANDKIWMRTPDGKRYDFTSRHLDTLYDSPAVWYVNKITDPNGNWIQIHYQGSGVLGNSNQLIDYVETSDGRYVDFGYELENTNQARLAFIEYDGKRWTYTYEDSEVTQGGLPRNDYYQSSNLVRVTTPDGDQWQYTYYGYTNGTEPGGGSLKTMTNPYGGVTTVTYEVKVAYAFDALNRILNRTVTRLERAGHSTYDYSYTRDSSGDTTTVISDVGTTTYRFDGLRSISDGEVWRIGVPREKTFDPISGPTSTTTYNYDRIPISFESDIRRERIGFNIPEDQRYFLPVLRGETFNMDQQDWEKGYDYGYQNWGDDNWYLFAPLRLYWIDETGPSGSRTLGNVFQKMSDYYMIGVRASGGVKVHTTGAVYENTRDFDEKGNVIKTMERSLGTTHTVDGEGNRTSSVTDGGVSRSFSRHERGLPGRIVTPGGLTIDQGIDAFGRVESRSFAGGTESIERDVAGRVQSVDPLQGLPTLVSWTSHSAVMTRGNLTHTYGFDDYGRVISETISAPGMETVNISRQYDSQDNVTAVTVNGSWVNYDYDGYGRITAINDNGAVTSFSYSPDSVTITNEVSGLTRHAIRSYSDPFTYEIMSVEQQGGIDIDIDRNEFGLVTRLASGGVERLYDYAGTYFYLHAYNEPETGRTEYAYNVDGQLRGELRYGNAGSENLLRLRELAYDHAGRVDWESVKAGGNRERLTDYVYDVLDRPTSINVQILEGGSIRDEVTTDFVYDLDDSILSKTVSVDDRSWQFTYAYDDYRNRAGVTYPSGNHYQIQANPLGQVLTYQGFADQANYHFSGALASLNFANGDHYTAQLNDRRVLASMNVTGANLTLIDLAYGYDDALNLTVVDDLAGGTRGLVAGYDDHSRLTSAATDRHVYSYDYDALNNLSAVSRDGNTSTLNYNAKNLLTQPDIDAPQRYAYNDLGEAETFGFYSGASIPPGGSFSWEAYPRSADGQLAGSYERHLYTSNAIRDFGEAYLYDHSGYLLRTQPRNVHYPADGSAFQVTEPRKPVYTLYNGQGRLAYELDSETGFQKEYHYLAGRLIGMTSIEYTCEDDVDGDGMGYCFERQYGFDFTVDDGGGDRDGDGLTNAEEFLAGSNPDQADTDGDLMPDAWEVAWGLDPTVDNSASDTDGDGLADTEEFLAGYDPSTSNLPDRIKSFDLSVSPLALRFQWNADQAPRARVYAGTTRSGLAPVKDIARTDAVVEASALPESGFVALASFSNEGETSLSETLFYDTAAGWGSIELPLTNASVYYADQRGLVVARERSSDDLVVYENQQVIDRISLSQYGYWGGASYLDVDEARNGDLVFGWLVGRESPRSLVLARYCRDQRGFCHHRLIGKGPHTDRSISEQTPSMDVVALNNQVFAKWREEEWRAPPSLVITDMDLQNQHFVDLDSIFSNGQPVRDVHLHEDRDGILLTGLQERGDATPEKLAFAHWTPLEGWKAGGVIPTYPESGRGRATTKVAIRADDAGRHYILVVSGDPSQTSYRDPVASRAAVIRETEGGWYRAGAIALDIESSGRGVDMVLSGDRLYILYHSNGQLYSHHASLSAPDLSFIEHSIQVDDYIIAGAQADQPGVIRGVIEIDGFTHLLRGDSAGLHPGGILPISDLISWLFSIGDQPLVISGSGDYRAQIAMEVPQIDSPLSNIIDFNIDPEEGYVLRPDDHDQLCPRWAVDYVIDGVELEQLSGPSLIASELERGCVALTIPRLATSEQADMSVTLQGPDGPETITRTFTVPAVDPVVTIDGPASIIEGDHGELAVQVEHAYGRRYDGPYSVRWTQSHGPERDPHYDQGWYTLWAPNVDQDTSSRYRAEVYFPEPDITREAFYDVQIQDTGGTVNLPPEIGLDVTPYSDFGYDMQRVSINTDVDADVTLRMYGSWSMLQDGNQPEAIPAGEEPETDFGWRYMGPFSAILDSGQHIDGMVRAEALDNGLVSYYSFHLGPPDAGPLDPRVVIEGAASLVDGEAATFQAMTYADASNTEYTGPVEYSWSQLGGPDLGITTGQQGNPLEVTLPDLQSDQDITLEVAAHLPQEGMTVTGQKTITLIDDESSGGQAPEISWTVEPYSAYGYDLNRVAIDAGDASVHMKIYGSWTMLSDGNQPTQVPSGSEPEPNYQYEYVAPFSILREPDKEMDMTIRAQSPTSGLISYDRVIVDRDGGTAAPVN